MNCAFCGADGATPVVVLPKDDTVLLCPTCQDGVENGAEDAPHWQCLNDAIWSEDAAVKVLAYRMLKSLQAPWANDVLDIAYLTDEERDWAEAMPDATSAGVEHRDSNGALLVQGDNVVLIKDLPVKGAGFTAKRGTAVRGISLVADNAEHIEGRVEGQRIVILTKFVKKS
ncbi:alkylphosphonate utilization protein [Rhodobacteraceae bacterium D3-12]|nr:alkylphosphonate utilization protein [Rhodobacteraceae bacterium D3-12]